MIYGLSGFGGSGKDTAFAEIQKEAQDCVRVAFADPLKDDLAGCVNALNWYIAGFDINKAEHKKIFRPMWVWWSGIFKAFDPMIWVKRAEEKIQCFPSGTPIIITDVRYDYEFDFIINKGGQVFYLERDNISPANDEEFISFFDIFINYPSIVSDPVYNNGSKMALGKELLRRMRG